VSMNTNALEHPPLTFLGTNQVLDNDSIKNDQNYSDAAFIEPSYFPIGNRE